MMALTPNVIAETPELAQGDTAVRPRPEPRISIIKLVAALAIAPAIIADQVTAEAAESLTPAAPAARPTGMSTISLFLV